VAVALAFEAKNGLILHVVRLIFGQNAVELFLSYLLFLAVGRLMTSVTTAVTPHAYNWLLERQEVLA
jgi:hypothetical protein